MGLRARYPWIEEFIAQPIAPGHYRLVMVASNHEIDKDYTPGVPPFKKLNPDELEQLRKRAAKDKAAAEELLAQYEHMSDVELLERFVNETDETAAAFVRQRFGSNEGALKKLLGKDYRPPHSATLHLRRGGTPQELGTIHSGGIERMTPEERALGFPRSTLATHTEARAVKRIQLQPGDILEIRGQYDPCGSCIHAMRKAAEEVGATIRYWWPGGSRTFP
jgi:hypothetical protein